MLEGGTNHTTPSGMTKYPSALNAYLESRSISIWIFSTLYTSLFACGIVFNIFMLYLLYVSKPCRTLPNLFVCSLSLADLVSAVCMGPMVAGNFYSGRLVYDDVVCLVTPVICHSAGFTNMSSIASIAFVRYVSIVFPNRKSDVCRKKVEPIKLQIIAIQQNYNDNINFVVTCCCCFCCCRRCRCFGCCCCYVVVVIAVDCCCRCRRRLCRYVFVVVMSLLSW